MRTKKILLAKLGLDVHNRGIITIAKYLSNEGLEVIYLGNSTPNSIINSAMQEDVDIVGISSLCGSHLTLGKVLLDIAKEEELDIHFIIGGVFPPRDIPLLKEIGFHEVFPVHTKLEEIIKYIKGLD